MDDIYTQIKTLIISVLLILLAAPGSAQYFGRNKVIYDRLDFRIYESPHFLIYHYLEDEEEIGLFARMCERWYQRHVRVFQDTLHARTPIILYNNHADFQQTTVIQDLIGTGVGGFAEGLRNRVVMPLSASRRNTDHVLGHELVHVFQYHLFQTDDTLGLSIRATENVPLWMMEGYAEYMAAGREDSFTAMWLRDAAMHDNIPTLSQMTNNPFDYNPYRFGHAFMAFLTGYYGDEILRPLHLLTGAMGYEWALDSLTGYSADTLSLLWAKELKEAYLPDLEEREESVGEKLFDENNAGRLNIAPSLSPDGQTLVFISNKNILTTDFFLADVEDKEIRRQITNILRDAHIDDYNYLESAGTWDPDGQRYAITVFSGGRNKILIADLEDGRIERTIAPPELPAFNNPSWSPCGKMFLVSGLKQGASNIYMVHLESGEAEQLTDDGYSSLLPSWSPDGGRFAFITDQTGETDLEKTRFGKFKLAEYDMASGNVQVLDVLPEAELTNPKYSPDGEAIFFISDADGYRNLYRLERQSGEIRRMTNLRTGISGITALSPGFDIAGKSEELVYILYRQGSYELHKVHIHDLDGPVFYPDDIDLQAGMLPPVPPPHPRQVVAEKLETYPQVDPEQFSLREYDPQFKLEYIGGGSIGVGVSRQGVGAGGGVSFMFSDILRENILMTTVYSQGRLIDMGGRAVYFNQSRRLQWGANLSHIPYRYAGAQIRPDTINNTLVENLVLMEERVFENELGLFGQYPLSKQLRFEGGGSATLYRFRRDSINNYYSGGFFLDREEYELDAPDPFFIYRAHIAFVGDGSFFGLTSPMRGYRYRLQLDRTFGEYAFWGATADYRRYFFMSPFSLAIRMMHYGRYGRDAQEMRPVYLGNPFFVRGYRYRDLRRPEETGEGFLSLNNLLGSKVAVVNAEIRYPFTGPEEFAIISSRMIFSDLVLFSDAGLAWHEFDQIDFRWDPRRDDNRRIPVVSAGVALRVNLFGAIILEPYYALPFQRRADRTTGVFGFHLSFGGF